MAENQTDAGNGIQLTLQRIYLKDASVESPNTPEIFRESWQPEVNVDLSSRGRQVGEEPLYEVTVRVTVNASREETTAFLIEVEQAGLFSIEGASEGALDRLLGSYCPNLLFPYVREVISDLVTRAGFPQFLLAPVNFEALYEQQRNRAEGESTE